MKKRHLQGWEKADASLGADLDASATQHLDSCARCGEEVREAAAVLATLNRDEAPDPGPVFWRGFARRVAREAREQGAGARRIWAWRPRLALAASLVVMLAIIVVGGGIAHWRPAPAGLETTPEGAAWIPLPSQQDDEALVFLQIMASSGEWEDETPCWIGDCLGDLTESEAQVVRDWLEGQVGRES